MTTSSPKLKQSPKTMKSSEQHRKCNQALHQYAERLHTAQAAQNKSSDCSLADFNYREWKYIENYGGHSYHHLYYPLPGITIIDETKHHRSKKFELEITEQYENAKWRFQLGMKVRIVITNESLGFL
ncbi:hypothetical protein B0H14DRAFT_2600757 [Mycena olivaceomarginata]|nr:hypothetical protein B0H14DRAFT_2600757 [Mycena olivaceomarginata]